MTPNTPGFIGPGASEILPHTLWMGGMVAFTQIPNLDLWVHCAAETEPNVPQAAKRIIWVRLDDSRDLRPDEKAAAFAAARQAAQVVARGGRVLISCMAGVNRSGLVTGLTLKALGFTGPAAIALIRAKRGPGVLRRQEYVDLLQEQSR